MCACAPPAAGNSFEWAPGANVKPADSTCTEVLAAGRTISDTFHLYAQVGVQSPDQATRIFQRTVVAEILTMINLPDTVVADFAWGRDSTVWRLKAGRSRPAPRTREELEEARRLSRSEFDSRILFRVTREGRVDSLDVVLPSQIRGMHEAFVAAVRRADSARALPPIPDNLSAPQIFAIGLLIRDEPVPESQPFRILQVRFATYTKEVGARTIRTPRYPPEAIAARREGSVMFSFVIDADGSVRRSSVRVLNEARHEFIRAVTGSLFSATFEPAQYRGCPIASHEHMPFEFAIGG